MNYTVRAFDGMCDETYTDDVVSNTDVAIY